VRPSPTSEGRPGETGCRDARAGHRLRQHDALVSVADPERRPTKAVGVYDEANDIAWPAVLIVGTDRHIERVDLPTGYVFEKLPTSEKLLRGLDGRSP